MKQYLLSIYTPEGPTPPPEFLEPIMRQLDELNAEMRQAGAWVFSGGLSAPSTATVLRNKGDDVLTVDGPYVEGKEYIGGFSIIKAADLDEALRWGSRLTKILVGLTVEVRPFEGDVD
ncbi:MAG TPA: YciI family protein [Pseudonocardiaceae bacterium]|jgi:hypothetical protein|nr:YciI family protein [Pseudonocardiaceae bacterium]